MPPNRRKIDPAEEREALERISAETMRLASSNSLNIGDQSIVVEAIQDARAYGARISACCELLGISVRTFERWRTRRALVLKKLGEAGI